MRACSKVSICGVFFSFDYETSDENASVITALKAFALDHFATGLIMKLFYTFIFKIKVFYKLKIEKNNLYLKKYEGIMK